MAWQNPRRHVHCLHQINQPYHIFQMHWNTSYYSLSPTWGSLSGFFKNVDHISWKSHLLAVKYFSLDKLTQSHLSCLALLNKHIWVNMLPAFCYLIKNTSQQLFVAVLHIFSWQSGSAPAVLVIYIYTFAQTRHSKKKKKKSPKLNLWYTAITWTWGQMNEHACSKRTCWVCIPDANAGEGWGGLAKMLAIKMADAGDLLLSNGICSCRLVDWRRPILGGFLKDLPP